MPELLIAHFDIVIHRIEQDTIYLYFEEKIGTPKEEKHRTLIAHGFHKEVTVQDGSRPIVEFMQKL